jgi:hypothetical protein
MQKSGVKDQFLESDWVHLARIPGSNLILQSCE